MTATAGSQNQAPGSSYVRSVDDLCGPAGQLEALLNVGRDSAPYSALVCHPNPLGGGTMHNKVVYHAMKALSSFGIPVLRFNFRSVGLSAGEHDHGHGEQDDVRAAVDWLDRSFRQPVLFAGFSFGSQVGMSACYGDARVKGLIGLGLPVHAGGRDYTYGFLPQCVAPKLFISGDRDEFGPREMLTAVWQRAPEPKRLVWIAGADHFFQGTADSPGAKLNLMQAEMRSWLQDTFALEDTAKHRAVPSG
jgi:alpha/beta superfamily hydrolase